MGGHSAWCDNADFIIPFCLRDLVTFGQFSNGYGIRKEKGHLRPKPCATNAHGVAKVPSTAPASNYFWDLDYLVQAQGVQHYKA